MKSKHANKVTSVADGQSPSRTQSMRTRANNGGRLDPEPLAQDQWRWRVVSGLELGRRPAIRDCRRCGRLHREKCEGCGRGGVGGCNGIAGLLALGAVLETECASLRGRFRRHRRAMARRRREGRGGPLTRRQERHCTRMRSQCPLQPENPEQGHGCYPTARRATHGGIKAYSFAEVRALRVWNMA
jgi:hypothetical protein